MGKVDSLLKLVAKSNRKRVQHCQLLDRNVCTYRIDNFNVRQDKVNKKFHLNGLVIESGEPFTHKLGLEYSGRKVRLWANKDTLLTSVRGTPRYRAFCSINRPDENDFMRPLQLAAEGSSKGHVFINRRLKPTEELLSFFSSRDVQQSVGRLIKHDNDSLHFKIDEVLLYSHPQTELEVTATVEILCGLVERLHPQRELWNLAALPSELQHLEPLIREWAESDDELRSDLLNGASDIALHRLIHEVAPFFEPINEFLSASEERGLSEAAQALQSLAECAAEAKIALKDRSEQN
jgi:hypothetical protein